MLFRLFIVYFCTVLLTSKSESHFTLDFRYRVILTQNETFSKFSIFIHKIKKANSHTPNCLLFMVTLKLIQLLLIPFRYSLLKQSYLSVVVQIEPILLVGLYFLYQNDKPLVGYLF